MLQIVDWPQRDNIMALHEASYFSLSECHNDSASFSRLLVLSKKESLNLISFMNHDYVDWLALHLKFGSVYFQQFGGISRPHVDQLQI